MASEQEPTRTGMDTVGSVLGLVVFVAGIAMIIWTFTMVRGVFDGVDEQIQQVRLESQQAAETAQAAGADSEAVTVAPGQGPSFAYVGATIGLQMLGLLVLPGLVV